MIFNTSDDAAWYGIVQQGYCGDCKIRFVEGHNRSLLGNASEDVPFNIISIDSSDS